MYLYFKKYLSYITTNSLISPILFDKRKIKSSFSYSICFYRSILINPCFLRSSYICFSICPTLWLHYCKCQNFQTQFISNDKAPENLQKTPET